MFKIKTLRKIFHLDHNKENKLIACEILIMFCICLIHAMEAGRYVEFWPINGTFQNFNPVRRFIEGQIPYRDFQDYLGMGHLYLGTIVTVVFGGDYQASLIAFSFLTFLGFALILFVIGYTIFRKRSITFTLINIILLSLLAIQPIVKIFAEKIGKQRIYDILCMILGPGNSARFIRGMILPISCILIWTLYKIYQRSITKNQFLLHYKEFIISGGIGLIGGFSFLWGNDYGISCWICLFILNSVCIFAQTLKVKKTVICSFFEMIISILCIFIFVEIFTFGHFDSWITSIFGTGGYQNWYYNTSDRSYYLYDIDLSWKMLLQVILCIIYLIKLFRERATPDVLKRYGILAYMNMACFCAVNEYHLLSNGSSTEVALVVLGATVLFEICYHFNLFVHIDQTKNIGIVVLASISILGLRWSAHIFLNETTEGTYMAPLGGYMTSFANDLKKTDNFLNGEQFFSTYASAQEVVNGTFQPSGNDYIIHVLGDEQRQDYLEVFKKGDFKYAATIKENITPWEYWVQRANWFFYRELYRDWHPIYSNSYEMYWTRNLENESHILTDTFPVNIQNINNTTKKVYIQIDPSINGIADVYINYEVKKNRERSAKLLFRSELKVENTGTLYADKSYFESNYLRNKSSEYIPIRIIDGYGEITLTSSPTLSTYLIINDIKCSDIYTTTFDFAEISDVEDKGNEIIFCITNDQNNIKVLDDIKAIKVGKEKYFVENIRFDKNYFYITIPKNDKDKRLEANIFKYNNICQIIK